MRRSDREITDFNEIVRVMGKCDVLRLAMHDGDYPYILPMNFCADIEGTNIVIYLHGAGEGKKIDLIKSNEKVGFEMDCSHRLVPGDIACSYTMEYESVIGKGTISIASGDDAKIHALNLLMAKYALNREFKFSKEALAATVVFKLSVSGLTGKRRVV